MATPTAQLPSSPAAGGGRGGDGDGDVDSDQGSGADLTAIAAAAAATATATTTTNPHLKRSLSEDLEDTPMEHSEMPHETYRDSPLALSNLAVSSSPYRTLPKVKEKPPPREGGSREKKDSQKKRDAQNALSGLSSQAPGKTQKHPSASSSEPPKLMRYRLPQAPREADYLAVKTPSWIPTTYQRRIPTSFYELAENPTNRKGYRYFPCAPTKLLPTLQYHATEIPPYNARISFEDKSAHVHIDKSGTSVTTEKGFRLARANVGVREGDWYYECKILSGIGGGAGINGEDGHVRVGWARREASLEAPIGFDAYSYGLRDVEGQSVHMSRPKDFMKESFVTGDVLGLHISLPLLATQRAHVSPTEASKYPPDVLRDRLPIKYKSQFYFEQFEYVPTKEMEELLNPANSSIEAIQAQEDDQRKPQYKTLPGSSIRVYKNGVFKGVAFENLFAFLPPASSAQASVGGRAVDDGACGYFPAVSVFRSGCVQVNFGPDWEHPPSDLKFNSGSEQQDERVCRPMSERYDEEIAEDITHDIIDEVDIWSSPTPNAFGVVKAPNAESTLGDSRVSATEQTEDSETHAESGYGERRVIQPMETTNPEMKSMETTDD